jgi:hypothetical protein
VDLSHRAAAQFCGALANGTLDSTSWITIEFACKPVDRVRDIVLERRRIQPGSLTVGYHAQRT